MHRSLLYQASQEDRGNLWNYLGSTRTVEMPVISIQASTSDSRFVTSEQLAIKDLPIVRRKWGVFVRGGVFFRFAKTNPPGGPGTLRTAI
jgi:hypothetical protein